MDALRAAATAFGAVRVAYGLGLFLAPQKVARNWLGPDVDRGPTKVGARGLGFRDAVVSGGVIAAVNSGGPARPWLAACALGDLADIAATLMVAEELPQKAKWGTVALAGSFAAIGAGLAVAVEH